MCRWLEDVFLKVHPQLLITVLIKGTHTSKRSSVTLVICNLSTGSISKRKLGLRWGVILFTVPVLMDTIWTNQIGYIHLLSAQTWKPRLKRFCVHPSSSPALSPYFTATQRRKEGVVDERKTDVPSLHAVHIISHGHPTYHVNVIKLKWEIIWKGELPHLSGLPHLPLVSPTSM